MAARPRGTVSLARALSKLGVCSRSEAIDRITDGRVSVDGRRVTDPSALIAPERARLAIDGRPLQRAAPLTIVLNKPRGIVSTRRDPEGRPTIYDLVAGAGTHLAAVGRLDRASSGLLIFTNRTQLAAALTDPERGVSRVYVVTVRGEVSDDAAMRAERGLTIDGEPLAARRMVVRKRSRRETHLIVELVEGRNREIRRLLAALGHEVTRLSRVRFGSLRLGPLEPGRWRALREAEVAALERDAGLKPSRPRPVGAVMTRRGLAPSRPPR